MSDDNQEKDGLSQNAEEQPLAPDPEAQKQADQAAQQAREAEAREAKDSE